MADRRSPRRRQWQPLYFGPQHGYFDPSLLQQPPVYPQGHNPNYDVPQQRMSNQPIPFPMPMVPHYYQRPPMVPHYYQRPQMVYVPAHLMSNASTSSFQGRQYNNATTYQDPQDQYNSATSYQDPQQIGYYDPTAFEAAQIEYNNATAYQSQQSQHNNTPTYQPPQQESQTLLAPPPNSSPNPATPAPPTASLPPAPPSPPNPDSDEDPMKSDPNEFLTKSAVQDVLSAMRLNPDVIYELRRKYHGRVEVSTLPFRPLSTKAESFTVAAVVPGLLEARIQEQHSITNQTSHSPTLIEYLENIGIPESHRNFMRASLLYPDLKYWAILILLAIYFYVDLPPV